MPVTSSEPSPQNACCLVSCTACAQLSGCRITCDNEQVAELPYSDAVENEFSQVYAETLDRTARSAASCNLTYRMRIDSTRLLEQSKVLLQQPAYPATATIR
jgi:hypothetical protein